jgi:hypothetical protein
MGFNRRKMEDQRRDAAAGCSGLQNPPSSAFSYVLAAKEGGPLKYFMPAAVGFIALFALWTDVVPERFQRPITLTLILLAGGLVVKQNIENATPNKNIYSVRACFGLYQIPTKLNPPRQTAALDVTTRHRQECQMPS